MTPEEATTIACITGRADSGCITCVGSACVDLTDAFPAHDWPELIASQIEDRDREPYLVELRHLVAKLARRR